MSRWYSLTLSLLRSLVVVCNLYDGFTEISVWHAIVRICIYPFFEDADEAHGIALRSYVIDLPVAAAGKKS